MTYKLVAAQTNVLVDLLSFAKSHEAGSKEQMGSDYRSVSIHAGRFQGYAVCTVDRTYLDSGKLSWTRKLYFQAGTWLYELRVDYPDLCRIACNRRWMETVKSVKLASTSEQPHL